jgi:hypothetical protein
MTLLFCTVCASSAFKKHKTLASPESVFQIQTGADWREQRKSASRYFNIEIRHASGREIFLQRAGSTR